MAKGAVPSEPGQQIGVDAQRRARFELGVLVDAMRPDDLLGRGHVPRAIRVRPGDLGRALDRGPELAAAEREDPAALPDLVFLGCERHRVVRLPLRDVGDPARDRLEEKFVAVARVGDGLGALDDVQAEIEGVAAEDVAHVVAGDDDHLEAGFFRNGFEPGRRHLARGSDGKPIAGDDERLTRVHARAEAGHQMAKRSRLPAFVQGRQALGHAVGGRRDLIRVDGVELLAGLTRIPEDQRPSAHEVRARRIDEVARTRPGQIVEGDARFQDRGPSRLHRSSMIAVGRGTEVPRYMCVARDFSPARWYSPAPSGRGTMRRTKLLVAVAVGAMAIVDTVCSGKGRPRHHRQDPPRGDDELADSEDAARADRRLRSAPHRIAEREGGRRLGREADHRVGPEERPPRALGVRSSGLAERARLRVHRLAGQGLARRRSAGLDAGHERRGHRFGRADRCAGTRHQGTTRGVLRRQSRQGEGQDRDARRTRACAGDHHQRGAQA